MRTLEIKGDFSLKHTLECGQFFRWEKIDDWYYIVTNDTLVKVRQENGNLEYFTKPDRNPEFISNVFRFDDDFEGIIDEINRDDVMNEATSRHRGLRLMRQEPFECLISFITSSNSSIKNIKLKLNRLSELYGDYIGMDGYSFYTFPKPAALASANIENLRTHRIGYHSEFIKKVSSIVAGKSMDLTVISELCYDDARNELIDIFGGNGVGNKVADCVCLFALDKLEAFPIDVWIERVMREHYFNGKEINKKEISEFAQDYFGKYAGYAQEYLYHFGRKASKGNTAN
jgi:N-glycosylase/DNA lyase